MAESAPIASTQLAPAPASMPIVNAGPTSRISPDAGVAAALPLRDVIAEPPSFWPPAPGWLILVGFILTLLWWLAKWLRRLSKNEYRALKKAAYKELQRIAETSQLDDQQLLAQVSALLKRVARQRYKSSVAQLSGRAWFEFLDSNLPGKPFAALGNADLFDAHYQVTADIDRAGLLLAAKKWLKAL